MAQSNTVELAQQGDATAIAVLMNRSLQSKGIMAEAIRSGNNLEITLHSQRNLNQKKMLDIIQKGLRNLRVAVLERILVRSSHWETELSLKEASLHTNTTISGISRSIQTQENRVSSPLANQPQTQLQVEQPKPQAGFILLPKLSQVQMSLQEYQDTIIRLTDNTGKKIICLCTLAELIQALHTNSPDLEHISQAIAKCSHTNEDGERIISNVAILQPEQSWQTTQIRCVLQIFFEMDQVINLPTQEDVPPEPVHQDAPEILIEPPQDQDIPSEITEAIGLAEETAVQAVRFYPEEDTIAEAPQVDPLFNEFNFTMIAPVQTVNTIDTVSDPTPPPPPDPLTLTLEDFRNDLLNFA